MTLSRNKMDNFFVFLMALFGVIFLCFLIEGNTARQECIDRGGRLETIHIPHGYGWMCVGDGEDERKDL